ncbi:hypothetical protein BsWGS_15491 [Bradybaena similaris]
MANIRLLASTIVLVTWLTFLFYLMRNLEFYHPFKTYTISDLRSQLLYNVSSLLDIDFLPYTSRPRDIDSLRDIFNPAHIDSLHDTSSPSDIHSLLDVSNVANNSAQSRSNEAISNMHTSQATAVPWMSKYRQDFLLWDRVRPDISNAIGLDVRKADNYFIYRCHFNRKPLCGGIADRLQGMVAAYVIANLTGRAFKIEMSNGLCDLKEYILPNVVNWTHLKSPGPSLKNNKSDSRHINMVGNKRFYQDITTLNFTILTGHERNVYFQANIDYSMRFRESTVYRNELSWMKALSPHEIQATLFRRLFKLSPRLQTKLQNILTHEISSPAHKLICAHLRMGRNPTIPHDSAVHYKLDILPVVWRFIANHSTTDYHKVFLMTDCELALEQAKLQEFRDRLIITPGIIKHVELDRNISQEELCDAMEKVILDLHLLMNCDVLMVSKSGLSRLAAFVRGSDSDLYCLTRSGQVTPCERRHLIEMYTRMGQEQSRI